MTSSPVLIGTVVEFDRSQRTGTLVVPIEEARRARLATTRLPFDLEHGAFVSTETGSIPIWTPTIKTRRGVQTVAAPPVGAKLVFEVEGRGPNATVTHWGFAAVWKDARKRLAASRPYHVLICDKRAGDLNGVSVWSGRDIYEMSISFPRPEPGQANHLIVDGVHLGLSIKRQAPNGKLMTTRDPRMPICCIPAKAFKKRAGKETPQPVCTHRDQRAQAA